MDDSLKPEADGEDDDLFTRLKAWFRADREHSSDWRKDAEEDFDFVAGRQYTTQEEEVLKDQKRPNVVFNRIQPVIDVVCGQEVANRQEVRFLPRTIDDTTLNERMTEAARWFRDLSDAEDEDSDAFRDAVICGMGWTETRYDADEDPEGKPLTERLDPFEMFWDCNARRANLVDARRLWRLKKMPKEEAERLFPEADEDVLNAKWASADADTDETHVKERVAYGNDSSIDSDDDKLVTIVECQWHEMEDAFTFSMPNGENIVTSEKEALQIKSQYPELIGKPTKRRIYKQAFIGTKIIETGPSPCGDHFSFTCITGKRDRNKGVWYGVVKPMKDPQRWANKWLSQAMHILNSNAKGGIFAEADAFEDQDEAERTYARADQITWVKKNALVAGKIQPKQSPPVPAGFFDLMNFAVSSVRDTSGVSVEMIGAQEANQAASLEYQRRQTSMTILASLFDSLRRYRKLSGRVLLYIIQKQISPQRMVRITSDNTPSFQPLTEIAQTADYDIIVDDAPTSPNQKEQAWQIMQQMLPMVANMMTPEMWTAVLEFSPLPSSVSAKFREAAEKAASAPPPVDPKIQELQMKQQMETQKMQMQSELEQQKMQMAAEVEKIQAEADITTKQREIEAQISLEQFKADASIALEREKFALERELKIMEANARIETMNRQAFQSAQQIGA